MGKIAVFLVLVIVLIALFFYPGYLLNDEVAEKTGRIANAIRGGSDETENAPPIPPELAELPVGQIASIEYPYPLTLQAIDGRTMHASVLGRSSSHVQFRRISDDKLFDLRFSNLSVASQQQLSQLPITLVESDFGKSKHSGIPSQPRQTIDDGLDLDQERINRKLKEIRTELSDPSLTSSQRTMMRREIERLNADAAKLRRTKEFFEE